MVWKRKIFTKSRYKKSPCSALRRELQVQAGAQQELQVELTAFSKPYS